MKRPFPLALLVPLVLFPVARVHAASADPSTWKYTWDNVRIVAGGFITGIVFHPAEKGLLYVRTDIGGAYRRDSTNKKWVPLTDWVSPDESNLLGIEAIGIDPTNSSRLYLALGTYTQSWAGTGAIVRSTDRGATFQRTNLPIKLGGNEDGRFAGERLVVDPLNPARLYFGSRNDGLWASADSAVTWSKTNFPVATATNGIGIVSVAFDTVNPAKGSETIYVGVSSPITGVYRSSDSGVSWEAVPGQPSGLLPNHVVLSPDGFLYITYGDQPGPNNMTNGAVWKYGPRDGTWTDITPPSPQGRISWGFGNVSIFASNPQIVTVSTLDRWSLGDDLYRSADGGATWRSVAAASTIDDSLSPWLNFGGAAPRFGWWMGALATDPFDPGHVLYGTGATIWESTDVSNLGSNSGIHWKVGADGIEETAVLQLSSPPAGPHLLSGVGDIGGFAHDDLYVSPRSGMSSNPVFGNTTGLDYAALNPSIVARVGNSNSGRGAWSSDSGHSWTPFPADAPGASNNSGGIAVSADGGTFVWSPGGSNSYYSRDSGKTWTASQGISNAAVTADRINPAKFYAFNGSAFVSTDGGANFAAGAAGLPSNSGVIRAVPGREGELWLPLSAGLYRSTDSGATFNHVDAVQSATDVGFGKSATNGAYPALYLSGRVNGVNTIYRSIDTGATWTRINDDAHQYGWVSLVTGDPRVFGRVYMATNGRGIIVGDITPPKGVVPSPKISAVVSGASFLPAIQSGAWVTILGENLSAATRIWSGNEIVNGVLPFELDGVRVSINGEWAPVYYISPTQINALAPNDLSPGNAQVLARSGTLDSDPATVQLQQVNPALFLFDPQNRKYAAGVAGDGSFIGPAGLFGAALVTRPARPGETVQFFGTGCGPTNPPSDISLVPVGNPPLNNAATATIGAADAKVQFAGLTGAGLCQFNVIVPSVADGDQTLQVTVNGVASPNGVFVSVKR